jgi:hypothetical protein
MWLSRVPGRPAEKDEAPSERLKGTLRGLCSVLTATQLEFVLAWSLKSRQDQSTLVVLHTGERALWNASSPGEAGCLLREVGGSYRSRGLQPRPVYYADTWQNPTSIWTHRVRNASCWMPTCWYGGTWMNSWHSNFLETVDCTSSSGCLCNPESQPTLALVSTYFQSLLICLCYSLFCTMKIQQMLTSTGQYQLLLLIKQYINLYSNLISNRNLMLSNRWKMILAIITKHNSLPLVGQKSRISSEHSKY